MGYTDIYSQAETTVFRQQCRIALVQAAINIAAEADTVDNHVNRVALAHLVLREPERYTNLMSYAIAQYASNETDAAIDAAIGGVWNAYATALAFTNNSIAQ